MTSPAFSITADGRLFHGGVEIGTISADEPTINGRKFVVRGRSVQSGYDYLQSYDIAASGNRNVNDADGTFVDVIDPEAVAAARAARAAVRAAIRNECLMSDGNHDDAVSGHDLCPACEQIMIDRGAPGATQEMFNQRAADALAAESF